MASASSSASTSYPCYDVFINHRGMDVKTTFATLLYRRLVREGLQVFLDKDELELGEPILSQIKAAIRQASVQVVIFSPNYAKSEWCLNELLLMVQSRATILPVFYHVQPCELRRTTGAYDEALQKLQEKTTHDPQTGEEKPRYDTDTIQSWRKTLSDVADISGVVVYGGEVWDEVEVLEKVVEDVLKKVKKTPLHVAKYPTGLAEKLEDFETTVLSEQQEVKTVGTKVAGIVGLGGVGKSTLAKHFFNLNRSHYTASSFLSEVRETARTSSLSYLQTELIKDLKHNTNIQIKNTDQGIEELKRHLASCHALVILDDVDGREQMEALLPIKDILSPESLVLITSRDKHVLRSSGVLDSSIYNLKGLNGPDSEVLFCSYAFNQHHPRPEFADLVDRFVRECDGLPLSLKVFGALVCGQEESYWEDILVRLHEKLPTEIQDRLSISYESLEEDDRSIFLDIVCFFKGEEIDTARRIWGNAGVVNLENKCLLEVRKNKIKMHDHIRDMGRHIAKGGSMPRRLCQIDEFWSSQTSARTEVRGISMVPRAIYRRQLWHSEMSRYKRRRHEMFGKRKWKLFNNDQCYATNLKFLATEDGNLYAILKRVQSPQLIWLRWYRCPYSCLPSWVPMNKLRILEVYGSRLKMLWQSETQAPLELRELNFSAPLSHFPKSIGHLQHLEKIVVGSHTALPLKTLPEEFCDLCSLKYLVLRNCVRLMSLPESFGKLTKLQHMNLSWASCLERLPESFGKLTNLQHIDLGDAFTLRLLPNSFGNLTNLQHINLRGASALQLIPNSFGNLTNLQHIDLEGASTLQWLPNSFGNLIRLKHLNLGRCRNLTISSGMLGSITTLEYLDLSHCKNVKELLAEVARQPSLETLSLSGTALKELPSAIGDLSNLKGLSFGSNMLEEFPPWCFYLNNLKRLNVEYCSKLKRLPDDFGLLTQLTELVLVDCAMEYLPEDLLSLKNLRRLVVWMCPLRELPFREGEGGGALNKLDSKEKCMFGLKKLDLMELRNISEVAFHEGVCPNLTDLSIQECKSLEELSLETLMSLVTLQVWVCPKVKSIQGLAQLTKLRHISVRYCDELRELPGVEHVMSLTLLYVGDCSKVQWGEGVVEQLRQRVEHLNIRSPSPPHRSLPLLSAAEGKF